MLMLKGERRTGAIVEVLPFGYFVVSCGNGERVAVLGNPYLAHKSVALGVAVTFLWDPNGSLPGRMLSIVAD